nr:MAG TPA: transcriptional regulator [Caudoviricetes sp.]
MNWQKEAVNDLRNYLPRKRAMESMRERKRALEEKFQSIKCVTMDADPVKGGGSRMEDNLLNNITERERLDLNMKATARLLALTEKGLEALDERQRMVLHRFFVDRPQDHVGVLSEELHMEKSRVYQLKDEALYHFTIGMFGIADY